MAGVMEPVEWQESAEELYGQYRDELDVRRRQRLQALWLVRQGRTVTQAAREAGVGRRTLTRWLEWYRTGGLTSVLERVPGHGARGNESRLSEVQKAELERRCRKGEFRSRPEVRDWVERHWGVVYRPAGMATLLRRMKIRPKVPRPQAERADPNAQERWKKGGLLRS
jgi:transposase